MTRRRNVQRILILTVLLCIAVVLSTAGAPSERTGNSGYHSPFDLAFSPDGKVLAVSDHTAGVVVLVSPDTKKVLLRVKLNGAPAGVAWSGDGKFLFVAEEGAGTVAEIDPEKGNVVRRFKVCPCPTALAVVPKRNILLVANSATHSVSVVDLQEGNEKARIPVVREPASVAVTADGALAVVANFLPNGNATDRTHAAVVSLINLEKFEPAGAVRLPGGSTLVRDVVVCAKGRWAYAIHTVGRFMMPTAQIERGWVNTNAISIIDLQAGKLYATVLLDNLDRGAADPWGLAFAGDGGIWISIAGTHHIVKLNLNGLHHILRRSKKREELVNELAVLHRNKLILKDIAIDGKGPRALCLSPDGKVLACAVYFSGKVVFADAGNGEVIGTVALGKQPEADLVRAGESIFHDATYCFQKWMTCATCHPGGRADGLNWDLLNDGSGNMKNTRSLLVSHKTPPMMSRGVRANMEVASRAGFRFILFRDAEEEAIEAVWAYLRALKPAPSPYRLPGGKFSERARRGRRIFENPKTGCVICHPAPLFTDLKLYDVGTRGPHDQSGVFDTPTLLELWRTAPYMHDGSAVTLREVFTRFNKKDEHGVTSKLSEEELSALVEYLLSL